MSIKSNIDSIRGKIADAAIKSGRDPSEVTLVAAAKVQPVEKIAEAIDAGVTIIGENRVSEAKEQKEKLSGKETGWHMIGHLQRNKVKEALGLFDMVHSLDNMRLAKKIEEEAGNRGGSIEVLLQLNISGEETKGGFNEGDVNEALNQLNDMKYLKVKGLMTMPPFFSDPEEARPFFRRLREIRDEINEAGNYSEALGHLSMGMSNDFEVAVEEGATMVRLGTVLFGERE